MRRSSELLFPTALCCLLAAPMAGMAQEQALPPEQVQVLGRATSLYLDVQLSMRMPRGHTLADVGPVIRNRVLTISCSK